MQQIHNFRDAMALQIAGGVRTLVLTAGEEDALVHSTRALGAVVDVETELYAALAAMIDDPSGYGLFVMDCDAIGGVEAGERAFRALRAEGSAVQVVLISRAFGQQLFPDLRGEAVQLRGPVSGLSLRVGVEHALRDRLLWNCA